MKTPEFLYTNPYLISLYIVLAAWLSALILRWVMKRYVHRWADRTQSELDNQLLNAIETPLTVFVVLIALQRAVLPLSLHPTILSIAQGVLFFSTILLAVVALNRLYTVLIDWYGERLKARSKMDVVGEFLPFIRKLGKIFIVLSGLVIVLQHFNYSISSIVVSMGVGSLAIALAARDTLANMIGGFLVMLDRPFRIGDRIELSDTQRGDVVEIGLRTTKIKTRDQSILIVPNAEIVKTSVVNQSYPDRAIRVESGVGVAYGSDIERTRALILEAGEETAWVLEDPAPQAFFFEFGDSSLNFIIRFWVENYIHRLPALDQVNERINAKFAEAKIEIPFPHRTIIQKS